MSKIKYWGRWIIIFLVAIGLIYPAFAYITYVHVDNTLVGGDVVVTVFASAPNQNSTQTLVEGTNYTIEQDVSYQGHTCRRYSLLNIPNSSAYLLFKRPGYYAIGGGYVAGSSAPTYHYVGSVTYYRTGAPTPPTIGNISVGYETAKVDSLTYNPDNPDYLYAGTSLEVIGAASPNQFNQGAIESYSMGEYVQGTKLESGLTYTFRISAYAAGTVYGDSSTKPFTMKIGGGAQKQVMTFESGTANGLYGITFFSMPFPPDANGKWYAFNKNTGVAIILPSTGTNEITTAADLVGIINLLAPDTVSTFGYWDKNLTQQKAKGVMFTYTPSYRETPTEADLTLTGMKLKEGEGYQVYINVPKVEILLKSVNRGGLL